MNETDTLFSVGEKIYSNLLFQIVKRETEDVDEIVNSMN